MERRPVPALKSHMGKEGEIIFAYPYRDEKIIRTFRDKPLHMEIETAGKENNLLVEVYADFPDDACRSRWKNIPMEEISPGRYKIDYSFSVCGLFEFKIKYSFDNGKSWFWDSGPVRKVLVDPPGMRSLRIYTLIPSVSGNISEWKQKLSEIRDMGFNAVHLLPVTKMGSSKSPYSSVDLFDIDPVYADPDSPLPGLDQFEGFVEEAGRLGIKLFIDIVVNHINPESEVAGECPEWIQSDENEPDRLKRAGCRHHDSWIRWEDLVLINYEHPDPGVNYEIWNYMYHYVDFWANYAEYTGGGLRFDNLHSSNSIFIIYLTGKLKSDYPDIILIGEYFSSKEDFYRNIPDWQLNLILGNPWEYKSAPALRQYLKNIHTQGGLKYFLPLTTHDTGSPVMEYGASGSTIVRYMVYALLGTGQTGIVQGTETGIEEKINFIGNSSDYKPGPHTFREEISMINRLLQDEDVFHEIGNINFVDSSHEAVIAAVRSDISGRDAWLLMANLDIYNSAEITINQKDFRLPFRRFYLINTITGREIEVADMVFDVALEPCGIKIYKIQE